MSEFFLLFGLFAMFIVPILVIDRFADHEE